HSASTSWANSSSAVRLSYLPLSSELLKAWYMPWNFSFRNFSSVFVFIPIVIKGLFIIFLSSYVSMFGHGKFLCKKTFLVIVHPVSQDSLYGLVIIDSIAQRPSAGLCKAVVADLFGKAQYPHTGPISLFGVLFALQYPLDI